MGVMRMNSCCSIAVALACLLALVRPAAAEDATYDEFRPVGSADWNATVPDSAYSPHVLVLYSGTRIDERDVEEFKGVLSLYERVRILDAQGIDERRSFRIPFRKGSKIRRLFARTVKPDGTFIEVPRNEIREMTLFESDETSMRSKNFAWKAVEPGDILEYYCTLEYSGWDPPPIALQQKHFVKEVEVEWRFRPDLTSHAETLSDRELLAFAPAWVVTHQGVAHVTVEQLPSPENTDLIRVTARDVPPFENESYMPMEDEVASRLLLHYQWQLREKRTPYWEKVAEDLGKATDEFLDDRKTLDRFLGEDRLEPRDVRSDADTCIRRIHERLKNLDRLKAGDSDATEEERDEWRTVREGIETGTMDEIDLTRLFVGLMRRLGHPATVFWTSSRVEGRLLPEWHSSLQFGLVGAAFQDGEELQFCFPGRRLAESGTIPWEALGCQVLLEAPGDKKAPVRFPTFDSTPLGESEDNQIALTAELRLDEEGRLTGRLQGTLDCQAELSFMESLEEKSKKDALVALREHFLPDESRCQALDETFTRDGLTASYACSLVADGWVVRTGTRRFVVIGALGPGTVDLPEEPRLHPIHFRYPYRAQVQIDLIVPEGLVIESVPEFVSRSDRALEYQELYLLGDGRVRLSRSQALLFCMFKPLAAPMLSESFRAMHAARSRPIVLAEADSSGGR
jgi:hypothetical protein